ncbi:MAG: indole-3-glycerol phosphate synthase TrpC [Actinomycetota bacterium]|nr:indole-3-glycerol phosphate synthase TrpC [Actinomycetota bacterium]
MGSRLEGILAVTREEVARRRRAVPLAELRRASLPMAKPFIAAIERAGLSLVAEHKRRSPSAGLIREGVTVEEVVRAYERGGAAALSILTDGPHFGGSLEDLRRARSACGLPILRKDFIVDSYQLHESRAAGADAILLIVAALGDGELASLHAEALELGLAAVVEVHDVPELERAIALGASLIGINNRDLGTMQVDPGRTLRLLERVPEGHLVVAESGLRDRSQLDELASAGVHGVLIGEVLMRAPDIEAACRTLTAARSEGG